MSSNFCYQMDPFEDLPLGQHPSTPCLLPVIEPHILRERISQELVELAAQEKALLDPIFRKRLTLNGLWNTSLPIHRLPNELLVQIFAHFPDAATPIWEGSFLLPALGRSTSGWYRWHRLMLVCRHWRAVFLSTRAFWRNVDLNRGIHWANLCLIRSAPASIHVYSGRYSASPLEVLHPHVHRIETLRLEAGHPEDPHSEVALRPFFRDLMPLLEDLDLSFLRAHKTDGYLTSQRLPRLRTLALYDTVAPRDTLLFAQLRALSLSSCPHALSFNGFLNTLAAGVQLEELSLRGTLRFPSGEWLHGGPAPDRPPISLPRLRKFTLEEHEIVHTSRLLTHLHIPPSAVLSIEADCGIEDPGTIGAMLPPNRSDTLPILSMAAKVNMVVYDSEYEITCHSVSNHGAVSEGSPRVRFALSTANSDAPDWDPFMPHGLADLVECFARAPLMRLTVTGDHTYATANAWETVFRTFAHLEELKICGSTYTHVTPVFQGLLTASTLHEDLPVACPNLKRIEVEGSGRVETYTVMRDCFRYRGDKGVVLQVLDLTFMPDAEGLTLQLRDALIKDMSKAVECIRTFGRHGQMDDEQQI